MIEAAFHHFANMNHWQIGLTVSLMLLQGAFFTVFPEEVIMIALGVLCVKGRIGFFEAMLFVQLGLLPANALMVFIGNRLGSDVFTRRPFCWLIRPAAVERATSVFRKHGQASVLFTRFTPVVRGPMYLAMGLSKMSVRRFFKLDAMASLVQVPLLILLGTFFP